MSLQKAESYEMMVLWHFANPRKAKKGAKKIFYYRFEIDIIAFYTFTVYHNVLQGFTYLKII